MEKASLDQFEFTTVAQFYRWLSLRLSLQDFNLNDIWSFRAKGGNFRSLLTKKIKVKAALNGNIELLTDFYCENEPGLDHHQLGLVAVLINNCRTAMERVDDHIEVLDRMIASETEIIEYIDMNSDEPPF